MDDPPESPEDTMQGSDLAESVQALTVDGATRPSQSDIAAGSGDDTEVDDVSFDCIDTDSGSDENDGPGTETNAANHSTTAEDSETMDTSETDNLNSVDNSTKRQRGEEADADGLSAVEEHSEVKQNIGSTQSNEANDDKAHNINEATQTKKKNLVDDIRTDMSTCQNERVASASQPGQFEPSENTIAKALAEFGKVSAAAGSATAGRNAPHAEDSRVPQTFGETNTANEQSAAAPPFGQSSYNTPVAAQEPQAGVMGPPSCPLEPIGVPYQLPSFQQVIDQGTSDQAISYQASSDQVPNQGHMVLPDSAETAAIKAAFYELMGPGQFFCMGLCATKEQLKSDIDNVKWQMEALRTEFESLGRKNSCIREIVGLRSKVSDSQISGFKSQIQDFVSDVNELKSKSKKRKGETRSLKERLERLESDVKEMKEQNGKVATQILDLAARNNQSSVKSERTATREPRTPRVWHGPAEEQGTHIPTRSKSPANGFAQTSVPDYERPDRKRRRAASDSEDTAEKGEDCSGTAVVHCERAVDEGVVM